MLVGHLETKEEHAKRHALSLFVNGWLRRMHHAWFAWFSWFSRWKWVPEVTVCARITCVAKPNSLKL